MDDTRDTTMGLSAITHTEITNWSEGMGFFVTPYERRALVAIDKAYRIYRSKDKE